jgi:LPXTG-motif cell wall-anchored protein
MGRTRKFMASTAIVATVGALGAAMLAAPGGAQVQQPPPLCTIAVTASGTTPGSTVSISGTAPASTLVTVFMDGPDANDAQQTATSASAPADNAAWGPVSFTMPVAGTYNFTAQLPERYGSAVCLGPNGETVIPVQVAGASTALPRTGSNNTSRYVIAAFSLIAIGAVFLIGAKRRREAHSRV